MPGHQGSAKAGETVWSCYFSIGLENNIEQSLKSADLRQIESRRFLTLTAAVAILVTPFASASAIDASKDNAGQSNVPGWVFPLNGAAPSSPPPYDHVRPLHVPNSNAAFTEAELNDLFSAADWRPTSHAPMPAVVAHGYPPDVYACGFCHTAAAKADQKMRRSPAYPQPIS